MPFDVQMMFVSSAAKGHDTYDLYFDSEGVLVKVCGHIGNAGFCDTRYITKR